MRTARTLALTMLSAAVAAPPAAVGAPPPPSRRDAWVHGDIPAAFRGTWVRGDAACGAPLSLTIEAKRVSFRNGRQAQRFDSLSICRTCTDPTDKSGTLWVRSESGDGSPFLLYLTPGAKPIVTMNWRPLEDVLPKRYPLAPEPLQKCPG